MVRRIKNIYHLIVAIVANIVYGFPGRKLTVIGITGTDGKTTTTSLVYHILKSAGKDVSLISTVAAHIGGKTYDTGFHVTNPASLPLQRFLRQAVRAGHPCRENYLVLEVTSHGIDQNRIWGIPFAVAGLTNITHEHLDYHKTYDNYVATKTKLLRKARIAIVNKDDASYPLVKKYLGNKKSILLYGKKDADISLQTLKFQTNLPGEYNIYNCLLAIAICQKLGVSDTGIQRGIETFTPPLGRTDIVYKKDFTIMIDFAHTPNAFEQLLSSLRPQVKGRLIHVFGSAGLRDVTKRPLMGKAASSYDDIIILTAEDPRTEKVEEINKQIREKISNFQFSIFNEPFRLQNKKHVFEINDRQKAIDAATTLAKKGDFIVITGKAHEQSMNYGQGEVPWSDYTAVEKTLAAMKKTKNK